MNNINNLILKSGIKSLLQEDDTTFKKSLINSLSLKLNDAVLEVQENFVNELFFKKENTNFSEEMRYFVEFVENYDSKLNNKLKLKNETVINISESEMEALKGLFDRLGTKNRETFVKQILSTPGDLKSNIEFYKKARIIL